MIDAEKSSPLNSRKAHPECRKLSKGRRRPTQVSKEFQDEFRHSKRVQAAEEGAGDP